jgi:tRNA pseudouridine55 synthase
MPDGFLIIDKPLEWTSFDVVARVRRLVGERRIGHAGTLDPLATGVLPLALGRATRFVEYLSDAGKAYDAVVHLGVSTTTYDREGEVIYTTDPLHLPDAERIATTLAAFRGPQEQVPPMHSAVKQGGKRLYELARAGREVERRPRSITIYRLDVIEYTPPLLRLAVECSKGTYIRTLAHDLGTTLGCGAHLAALVRTQHGPFTLAAAVTLAGLEAAVAGGTWTQLLQPVDRALTHLPALTLDADEARRVGQGQGLARPPPAAGEVALARLYGPGGRLLALAAWQPATGRWQPTKVLLPPDTDR